MLEVLGFLGIKFPLDRGLDLHNKPPALLYMQSNAIKEFADLMWILELFPAFLCLEEISPISNTSLKAREGRPLPSLAAVKRVLLHAVIDLHPPKPSINLTQSQSLAPA